ncbi:MAG TPA: cupin domain-containing protein [Candidatus Limnocylindrales bacterium]|nr:cupin domain-containing protein [Candidatus Limnocylindrales bacterium]
MTESWRPVTRLEPADFTADWRAASERNAAYVVRSPIVARGRDLTWIETPNEHRLAMLIGEQVGFPTNGTNLCKAIVPPGSHTGNHRHGEEALHVLSGTGAALIGGRRYDIRPGTTLHVPYMDAHQLVNLGDDDMEVVTASTVDLDLFVRLGRFEQLEEKGENTASTLAALPAEDGQFDALGRRIALHLEDAPNETENRRASGKHGHAHTTAGHDDATRAVTHPRDRLIKSEVPHRHGAVYDLMGGGESKHEHRNGFTSITVAMTQIFEEIPHTSSHDHTHTEAVLYVLEGVGYSEIDGVHYDWEAGDAVQIPPKMTRHEHFNPSDARTRTLRIEYGIRYFYEQLWPGYFKIEHRETSVARP